MMTFTDFIFYGFSLLLIMAATMVIIARNPVYAVLYLIFSFLNAAALFIMIGAEFIAMILVIVYVGAVAVLFLFVVMMLDINIQSFRKGFVKYLPVGIILGAILLSEILFLLFDRFMGTAPAWFSLPTKGEAVENIKQIGALLYTTYFYVFQIGGVILLAAMVAAIVLTLRSRPGVRRQNIATQVSRDPANTIELVDIPFHKGVE